MQSENSRILVDAGFQLILNKKPVGMKDENGEFPFPYDKLIASRVLPDIKGLYAWDEPMFDAVLISHAHIDHYGLLDYVNPAIPVYLSKGTRKMIDISVRFTEPARPPENTREFKMYKPFQIGGFRIMPFLMDHSAFDAAAFEISDKEKTMIYICQIGFS